MYVGYSHEKRSPDVFDEHPANVVSSRADQNDSRNPSRSENVSGDSVRIVREVVEVR